MKPSPLQGDDLYTMLFEYFWASYLWVSSSDTMWRLFLGLLWLASGAEECADGECAVNLLQRAAKQVCNSEPQQSKQYPVQ